MSNTKATGVAYLDPEFSTMYATEEIGYAAGAQGTVTQGTSKSTGVTLNKSAGRITMNGALLAANTAVSFTLTNSLISTNDTIIVCISGGATAASPGQSQGEGQTHSVSEQLETVWHRDAYLRGRLQGQDAGLAGGR